MIVTKALIIATLFISGVISDLIAYNRYWNNGRNHQKHLKKYLDGAGKVHNGSQMKINLSKKYLAHVMSTMVNSDLDEQTWKILRELTRARMPNLMKKKSPKSKGISRYNRYRSHMSH